MEVEAGGKLYKAKPAGKLGYFGVTLRIDDAVLLRFRPDVVDSQQVPMIIGRVET